MLETRLLICSINTLQISVKCCECSSNFSVLESTGSVGVLVYLMFEHHEKIRLELGEYKFNTKPLLQYIGSWVFY